MSVPYYVDLFYEDIGFTNDYSNVLQFNSKEERETYFDNIAHYRMENTEFNNMNIEGNSVKIAFYDLQSVDLDEINYIRIATRLYGSSTTIDTLEYGFVTDYEVISSAEDCTVVEFTFEKDIWMNYQFNFTLKMSNVERCHIDRWNTDRSMIYTKPSEDAVESYMRVITNTSLDKEYDVIVAHGTDPTVFQRHIALVVITYLKDDDNRSPEALYYLYYIVDVDNPETRLPAFRDAYYPSLAQTLTGNIASYLGLTPSRVKNMYIITNPNISVIPKYNWDTTKWANQIRKLDGTGGGALAREPEYDGIKYAYVDQASSNKTLEFKYPWINNDKIDVDIDMPVCPVNGDTYSDTHEPMLYKNPVRKRYITNKDFSAYMEIPDILLKAENYITYINQIDFMNAYNTVIFNREMESSIDIYQDASISACFSETAIVCDVINSLWDDYYLTTRNTDREMMAINMLTGGISDSGSTAISAGIGLRSNLERSEISKIRLANMDKRKKRSMRIEAASSDMYAKYAKQAAGMSIAGGIAQYGANALGTYMGQELKEKAIKNTPASVTKTGSAFSIFTFENTYLHYLELKCDDTAYEQYANIFNRFGYAINAVITPNIKSRKYFDYIKTNGAILTGNVNQAILTNLGILFDHGMTIWHMDCTTKNTLYTYDKENIERTLMVADYHYTQIETVEDWNEAVSHLDIMKVGSRLRIVGTSGTDRLQSISWRNVNTDVWNANAGSPYTACDIHLDTAGTYEIYGTFKINGEFVDTNITRFKVIE